MDPRKPYETGDVLWAPDPYHGDDPALALGDARPWLVISTKAYPNQGQDYLCCALTSKERADATLLALDAEDWARGHPRRPSSIDPQTVLTVKHGWVSRYVGRVADAKVNRARNLVKSFL